MTDSIRVFDPGFRVTLAGGTPASGATIEFYNAGGHVERTVYSNSGLSTSLGDTVTCNAAGVPAASGGAGGEVLIYTGTSAYKVIIKDADGNTLHEFDNIAGALDTSSFESDTALPRTPVLIKSTDYVILAADRGSVINTDSTGGTVTHTLPSAVTVGDNWRVTVRHIGTANSVVVSASGGQTINGATSQTLAFQYESLTFVSDGANWHISEDAQIRRPAGSVTPQGRLTLTSGTPVLSSDATAQTTVYYTPYVGNLVPIYNGTRFIPHEFSELTLTLVSQHTASAIFDVFAFLDGSTVRIGTGPAWSSATAGSASIGSGAGTSERTRVGGLLVNAVQVTARNGTDTYTVAANKGTCLGSLFIDSTQGQVTCHVAAGQDRKWSVWNAYNQARVVLKGVDSTASWTYDTDTFRAANGSSSNKVTAFVGATGAHMRAEYHSHHRNNVAAVMMQIGIGVNSTSSASGVVARRIGLGTVVADAGTKVGPALYEAPIALGLTTLTALERSASGGTSTWFGGEDDMLLSAEWMG